jgi:heme exporter protein CcmD
MTHAGYILAAYLAAALVVGGLIVWVIADNRMQKRRIEQLEAEGVRRRSAKGATGTQAASEAEGQS